MACPICENSTEPAFRPFCSKRCADVDLGRWFSGFYAIPSEDVDDEALENGQRNASDEKPH